MGPWHHDGLADRLSVVMWLWLWLWLRPPLWSSGQSSWLHNGDVLCFLWGPNWIYICYAEESRPPLWSSGQSSKLQIQRCGFDSRRYQIFWEVVGLKRSPLCLVSTIEERKSSADSDHGVFYLCIWPWRPIESRNPHYLNNRLIDGGYVVSLTRRPHFTPRNIFWYSFLLEAE
jgi:hypothetical protein